MIGRRRRKRRPEPPCRAFTLGDAAIVVAGSALWMAAGRDELLRLAHREYHNFYMGFMFAGMTLNVAALTVLALRLRSPRPPLRRLARQPGAVACSGVVGQLIVHDILRYPAFIKDWDSDFAGWLERWEWMLFHTDYFNHQSCTAAVVPVLWLLLLAGGRWRPEPGWIDRAGRLVGWSWIAWLVAGWSEFHLSG